MRGLTIIVATADELRLRSAIGLALSTRAHGGNARLFLDTAAVSLVRPPVIGDHDDAHLAAGLPGLAALIEEALNADIGVLLCQAGMAMAGVSAQTLDPRVAGGGMIGLLAELGDDRLAVV